MTSTGSRLRIALRNRDMTIATLVRQSGISRSYVEKIIGNRQEPSREAVKSIADVLKVSVDYLLCFDIKEIAIFLEEAKHTGVYSTEHCQCTSATCTALNRSAIAFDLWRTGHTIESLSTLSCHQLNHLITHGKNQ